jgi:hypothetical protein
MGLLLNLIVQTIVWFGFMGVIIFVAGGTINYAGGWLYLGEMVAISVVFGLYGLRVDPGLLRERLKPPVQKDQPLADKLVLIPFLLLVFGAMGFMAADAARWHWSAMPSSVRGQRLRPFRLPISTLLARLGCFTLSGLRARSPVGRPVTVVVVVSGAPT